MSAVDLLRQGPEIVVASPLQPRERNRGLLRISPAKDSKHHYYSEGDPRFGQVSQ